MTPFTILDGAMGSELIKRGLTLPRYIWSADANIHHPELVQQIHREYIDAGADYITANTFRTTPRAYAKAGVRSKAFENSVKDSRASLNKAIELAKSAAGTSVKIIGSIAPLEDCYRPDLFPGRNIAITEFFQLGKWLTASGIDIIILETMNSIVETRAALDALKNFKIPIWVSFVLKDENYLLSGDLLNNILEILNDYEINIVFINCNSLDITKRAVDNIVNKWSGDWGIYPNLGKGDPSPDGYITKREHMKKYLSVIKYSLDLGASVIGGCCGSSPKHIAEIKKLKHLFAN